MCSLQALILHLHSHVCACTLLNVLIHDLSYAAQLDVAKADQERLLRDIDSARRVSLGLEQKRDGLHRQLAELTDENQRLHAM